MIEDCSDKISITFRSKFKVPQGFTAFLLAQPPEPHQNIFKSAIPLHQCIFDDQSWVINLKINASELSKSLKHKYFAANQDISQNEQHSSKIIWERQSQIKQRILSLKSIQIFNSLSACSFNIRYLTKKDEGDFHWDARKQNITQFLLNRSYDFVGLQQATFPQRKFLSDGLADHYDYFGWGQQGSKQEECGIYVKRCKYEIVFKDFQWISETKEPKSIAVGAKRPRYFTTIVVTPKASYHCNKKIPCYLLINLHLDNQGENARELGIRQSLMKCKKLRKKIEEEGVYMLMSCVVMGDYNLRKGNSLLQIMRKDEQMPFKSMRSIKGADKSITFNGFKQENKLLPGQSLIKRKLTIDHIFLWVNEEVKIGKKSFIVDRTQTGSFLSDHYPIVAILGNIF